MTPVLAVSLAAVVLSNLFATACPPAAPPGSQASACQAEPRAETEPNPPVGVTPAESAR